MLLLGFLEAKAGDAQRASRVINDEQRMEVIGCPSRMFPRPEGCAIDALLPSAARPIMPTPRNMKH